MTSLPRNGDYFYYGQPVRIVMQQADPWFVAKDVCAVLEVGDVSSALRRLDEDEKGTDTIPTPGGQQEMSIVSEAGLYALILTSRKPEAKAFKRWITHEVLPSIRKSGSYVYPPSAHPVDERTVRTELLKAALEHEERLSTLEQRISTVENNVTLSHGEQRALQRAIGRRVYELEANAETRRELFRQAHREIKDRWGVSSYRDVKRTELSEVMAYIKAWKPKLQLVV